MIQTKQQLQEYLRADSEVQIPPRNPLKRWRNHIYMMKVLLRKSEYHYNNRKNFYHRCAYFIQWHRCLRLQRKYCAELRINVFGKGLTIWHPQRIIVNPHARIGDYCSISTGVIIAHAHGGNPIIGNHVELMVDSKVLGEITVANHVRIGANTLVLKDITEPDTTWVGNPAHKVNNHGTIETPVPVAHY